MAQVREEDIPYQQQSSPPQHQSAQQQQQPPHLYRPIPRRNFSQSSDTSELWTQATPPNFHDPRLRSSDFLAQLNAKLLRTNGYRNGSISESVSGAELARNQSYMNMGSTLHGIYDDDGSSTASVTETPWGMSPETPVRRSLDFGYGRQNGWENGLGSPDGGLRMKESARRGTIESQKPRSRSEQRQRPQKSTSWKATAIVGKLSALFLFGVVYGVIVSHLHDTGELAAVHGDFDRGSWIYLASWGFGGVVLGSLLPYVDLVRESASKHHNVYEAEPEVSEPASLGERWNDVVRSIGAFMGIAFAIRRLPWQSTLQLTLTLALVNPALWYILDRSKNGLSFSLVSTSVLTSLIFLSNPDVLPSPVLPAPSNSTNLPSSRLGSQPYQPDLFAGLISYDNLATVTWVGSVIFCSCVCFGGIGRRLAVLDHWS